MNKDPLMNYFYFDFRCEKNSIELNQRHKSRGFAFRKYLK